MILPVTAHGLVLHLAAVVAAVQRPLGGPTAAQRAHTIRIDQCSGREFAYDRSRADAIDLNAKAGIRQIDPTCGPPLLYCVVIGARYVVPLDGNGAVGLVGQLAYDWRLWAWKRCQGRDELQVHIENQESASEQECPTRDDHC